jgi:hypothetical protein
VNTADVVPESPSVTVASPIRSSGPSDSIWTRRSSLEDSPPSSAVRRSWYWPLVGNVALVLSDPGLAKEASAPPGPLSVLQASDRFPEVGTPSSVTKPSSWTVSPLEAVWSGPASTQGRRLKSGVPAGQGSRSKMNGEESIVTVTSRGGSFCSIEMREMFGAPQFVVYAQSCVLPWTKSMGLPKALAEASN